MPWKDMAARDRYMKAYNARPEQIRRRTLQNKARRDYEAKHGDLPHDVQVDHRKALDRGGTNAIGNLRAISEHDNKGYPRDAKNQPTGPARDTRHYGKGKR